MDMKNKALAALDSLIGEWEYTMHNCWFLESLGTQVKGFTTIEAEGLHTLAEASEDEGKTWRKDIEMAYVKAKSV